MTEVATTPQEPFKVGDLVRVKAREYIVSGYRGKVGPIIKINPKFRHPYRVAVPGGPATFAEDELEKI